MITEKRLSIAANLLIVLAGIAATAFLFISAIMEPLA